MIGKSQRTEDEMIMQYGQLTTALPVSAQRSISTSDLDASSDFANTRTPRLTVSPPLVSVVLPTFNEIAILKTLSDSLAGVLHSSGYRFEIIFVNDGSSDGSAELLDAIAAHDLRVKVIHLSRNFGHQPALLAGLQAACGDAVIVMDSDMQDDPSAIPRFLEQWEAGYDVVYAIRSSRTENLVKRTLFRAFYRILRAISQTPIPVDAGSFGLIDRRVAVQVASMPERGRFYAGLRRWVGFKQIGIDIPRKSRHDKTPRVSFWGLVHLAKTAVFSFSNFPLMAFYGIAVASCSLCAGLSLFALYHNYASGMAVPGWTSAMIAASFFGTLNALGVAVLGEYVVAIYEQVQSRPQYIVERSVNMTAAVASQIHGSIGPRDRSESDVNGGEVLQPQKNSTV